MRRHSLSYLSCLFWVWHSACTADNEAYLLGSGDGGAPAEDLAQGACADNDHDGVTGCAGDCDDGDATNTPGAMEICGDSRDNNCDGKADEGCGGQGTYVSKTGNDNNPGTQAKPVLTIGRGIANALKLGGGPVHIAAGQYGEKIKLVEGISLFGGYQCGQGTCSWSRDPRSTDPAYETVLFAADNEGVLADKSITRTTRLDGLRVVGSSAAGASTVALSLDGGTPTVASCRIQGGNITGGAQLSSAAVRIYASNDNQGAYLVGNDIRGGGSSDTTIAVQIQNRPGSAGSSVALITNNTIVGGNGRVSYGVLAGSSAPGTLLEGNTINAGSASDGGVSWAVQGWGTVAINANRINADPAQVGTCAGLGQYCGGISSQSATMRMTNNVISGLNSALSAGVFLQEVEGPAGEVVLNGNYVSGGGRGSAGDGTISAAVVVRIGQCNTCGFRGIVGRVRNNILSGGRSRLRIGVLEDAIAGKGNRPEVLEHNFFAASSIAGRPDVLYRSWDGARSTDLTTAAQVNQLTKPQAVGNLSGDPMLDATYHLSAGSPCIDKGVATEAPARDIDGQARPRGVAVDIGPDEAQ